MDYIVSNRLFMAQLYIENVLERDCHGITSYEDAKIVTRPEHITEVDMDRDDPPTLLIVGTRSMYTDEIVNVATALGWKIEEVHL